MLLSDATFSFATTPYQLFAFMGLAPDAGNLPVPLALFVHMKKAGLDGEHKAGQQWAFQQARSAGICFEHFFADKDISSFAALSMALREELCTEKSQLLLVKLIRELQLLASAFTPGAEAAAARLIDGLPAAVARGLGSADPFAFAHSPAMPTEGAATAAGASAAGLGLTDVVLAMPGGADLAALLSSQSAPAASTAMATLVPAAILMSKYYRVHQVVRAGLETASHGTGSGGAYHVRLWANWCTCRDATRFLCKHLMLCYGLYYAGAGEKLLRPADFEMAQFMRRDRAGLQPIEKIKLPSIWASTSAATGTRVSMRQPSSSPSELTPALRVAHVQSVLHEIQVLSAGLDPAAASRTGHFRLRRTGAGAPAAGGGGLGQPAMATPRCCCDQAQSPGA